MKKEARVYAEPIKRTQRLQQLDLREELLLDAVQYGQRYAVDCTLNDPPILAGVEAWGKTTRFIRDRLMPLNWERDNARNYATTIHPSGRFAIAACGGDANTGLRDKTPSTRSDKGPATKGAIADNQLSFADYSSEFTDDFPRPKQTWLLLYYRDERTQETRVELSLPVAMSDEGFVSSWRERIILSAIPFVPVAIPEETQEQSIQVNIERRQS
jgi:hypothetical protein